MKLNAVWLVRGAVLALALVATIPVALRAADAPQTERRYLSGHGPKDAVPWNFTVTGGRRAGEHTTIPVPSNWELHGFGTYNYGQQANKSDEHGLYATKFSVPADWKGRRVWLVFEGVMTDATATVNGKPAGPTHEGGFYRFRYDVSSQVRYGADDNTLEVEVAKQSADRFTERAERDGDYWVFGGIYRPVWLEATPAQAIDKLAIDGRADGALTVDVTLSTPRDADRVVAEVIDAGGKPVGTFNQAIPGGGTGRLRVSGHVASPQQWSAETPHLYTLRASLWHGTAKLHAVEQKFGFRTFEVRAGKGLFLNGQRVLLKGVDRHSFRPESGRALNPEDCYADAKLIREMNMNAVRMSHYPPDEAFLNACDELGLYVLDELSGWHWAHDTANGRILVREMIERDVNHPSILIWDNGNEGGWNRDLDGDFALYDPQHRPVMHPWEPHDGINTKHYSKYNDLVALLRGPDIVMPTEALHALYDGGAGAGLADYWRATEDSPFGGGMFIWDFADEGVVRTDQNGRVDVFSTYGPDGIVGPHMEKEGSYWTVRDVWSPVQIDSPQLDDKFDGTLVVHNRYDFTSLAQCKFSWKLVTLAGTEKTVGQGAATAPAIAPHGDGKLNLGLPANWRDADMLAVTATDPNSAELWTWTWPTAGLSRRVDPFATKGGGTVAPTVQKGANEVRLVAGEVTATFDAKNGSLQGVSRGGKTFPLWHGPRLAFARPPTADVTWLPWVDADAKTLTRSVVTPAVASVVEAEVDDLHGGQAWAGFKLELSTDGTTWHTIFDATRRPQDGNRYEFPPQTVAAVRLSNVRRFDDKPPVLKSFRLGYTPARFPAVTSGDIAVTSGTERDSGSGQTVAWLEARGGGLERARWTLRGDGSLRLDYAYSLEGAYSYHGITFDFPDEQIASFRWLGEGPYRVWQNRTRGTWFGIHEHKAHVVQPGESWEYPEFEGYFAGMRWATLATLNGPLTIGSAQPDRYFRVGTPRINHKDTTIDFPAGEISFLHAIPGMGNKGHPSTDTGPAGQFAHASGRYEGTLVFRFGD